MRKKILIIGLSVLLISCEKSTELPLESLEINSDNFESCARLSFENDRSLEEAIQTGAFSDLNATAKRANTKKFVSMLSNAPSLNRSDSEIISYYEAFGYDTLVPNRNFAALLSPLGELQVGNDVIRITPKGTYRYSIAHESEFLKFIEENSNYEGQLIENGLYRISENIVLYKTFIKNTFDDQTYSHNNDILPNDKLVLNKIGRGVPEPNFDSFNTYPANRKTDVGKFIQSIIGTTQERTIKFNSRRRLQGSFYSYNYGVYAEIGVNGHTDKKNWIGWSKTASDELRVGWRNIKLKCKVSDYYKQQLSDLNSTMYNGPQYMIINGKRANVGTLIMPDYKPQYWEIFTSKGTKALFDFLKRQAPSSEWDKAEALIVATRTEVFLLAPDDDIVKYNTKSYTHTFKETWLDFEIGYNNKTGFFINGFNQNNYNKFGTYLSVIATALNEKKPTLEGGEVYCCARFGNDWRGMKIKK